MKSFHENSRKMNYPTKQNTSLFNIFLTFVFFIHWLHSVIVDVINLHFKFQLLDINSSVIR